MATDLPVGTVLAYAGTADPQTLKGDGWLPCDGTLQQLSEYGELYQAIGTVNGGDGTTVFNLPNYQGIFLRGVDGGTGRDPDAASRTAPASGGASGSEVGSLQTPATANARTPFQAAIPHLPGSYHHAYASGTGPNLAIWPDDAVTNVAANAGGDSESRPINAYVSFIIKYTDTIDQLPAGTILAFAGTQRAGLGTDWLFCDGTPYDKTAMSDLYNAIATNWGGSGNDFNVPNLQGLFLRGWANGNPRDPDRAHRTTIATGGATGDNVGSLQPPATGLPAQSFVVDLPNLPLANQYYEVDTVLGNDEAAMNFGSVTVNLLSSGGDKESRPVNAYIDWFTKYVAASSTDTFPIGAVIAVPGNTTPATSTWLACDGRPLTPGSYPALFAVIGTAHGGDGATSFYLPDYRGRFLRGVDNGTGRDPDTQSRIAPQGTNGGAVGDHLGSIQDWATMPPATKITAAVQYLPASDHQSAAAFPSATKACEWNVYSYTAPVKGGDQETRPYNAYVYYFIKYAASA